MNVLLKHFEQRGLQTTSFFRKSPSTSSKFCSIAYIFNIYLVIQDFVYVRGFVYFGYSWTERFFRN